VIDIKEIIKRKKFKRYKVLEKYEFDIYKKEDFQDLMRLYERCFPGYMTEKLWDWKNVNCPFGEYLTHIIKDKEKIVSAYSNSFRIICINGKEYIGAITLDIMTDPDYRGKGLVGINSLIAFEYGKANKTCYVAWGYPNITSRRVLAKKAQTDYFNEYYYTVEKNLKTSEDESKFNDDNYEIQEIKRYNEEIDEFWEKSKNNYPIIIKRDKVYLNWRFVDHPLFKYRNFIVKEKETQEIYAYFILKIYRSKSGDKHGHIVDFLLRPHNIDEKIELFKIIENYSTMILKEDCVIISFWVSDNDLKEVAIKKLNYRLMPDEMGFQYRIVTKEKESIIINNPDNWYQTMGNTDVY